MKPQIDFRGCIIEPANHFGLFIYNFCERTNQSLVSLAECTGFSKQQLLRYVTTDQKPTIQNMILLASTLACIAKTSKYKMFTRLYDAIEKDVNKKPFPPQRNIEC